jgi:hypothetical protein
MKSMSGKELAKLLEANGWDLLRIQDRSKLNILDDRQTQICISLESIERSTRRSQQISQRPNWIGSLI